MNIIIKESHYNLLVEQVGLDEFMSIMDQTFPDSVYAMDTIAKFIRQSGCQKIELINFKYPALGAALHDRVILNNQLLKYNFTFFLYAVFHEIAHQYQYKKYGIDKMYGAYVGEIPVEEAAKFIKIWNSSAGQYVNGAELSIKRHDVLDLEAYIHITSPIRRLVDLLNIIQLQKSMGIITLSENAYSFYEKWLNQLDYINTTMRSIRKVQCDCNLLHLCVNNEEIMEKQYDGYVFDKIHRNDGLIQYMVFLPELKLSSRITLRDNFENFENKKFMLYLFNDEEKFKQKIRLHLL